MNCLNDEQLQALADGEGNGADRAHAASCPACGARLRDRAALMASIEQTLNPAIELPGSFRLQAAEATDAWTGKAEATGTGATRLRRSPGDARSFRLHTAGA